MLIFLLPLCFSVILEPSRTFGKTPPNVLNVFRLLFIISIFLIGIGFVGLDFLNNRWTFYADFPIAFFGAFGFIKLQKVFKAAKH